METLLQNLFADTPVLTVPWSIDYFSVIAGVLTGALFACDRKLDIIGTVVCGLITGYGGGVLRDTLMQGTGVYFTSHPDLIVICILLCAFVFYFRGVFRHLEATVFFADALSVGLFALAGASKAVAFQQGMVLSIIMGAITAVGGGAIRDICVGEIPSVFKRSNYYAVAGLGGATAYVVLARFGCPLALAGVACYGLCVVFQLVTLPTEFNASHRALRAIEESALLLPEEQTAAKRVLTAAALTYVAALSVTIMQFLRLLLIVTGGNRRRD